MNEQLLTRIKADIYRYYGKTGSKYFFKCFIQEIGFRVTLFYRLAAHYKKYNVIGLLSRVFYRYYFYFLGFQIPLTSKIGKGLIIKHFGSIVLNGGAIIGDNCYISHGITIGQTNRGKMKGVPKIGNKVWLGPNCVVVGNIQIGDNVLIAPNAYVNFDVPPNSIVIGNPAKIVYDENATDCYINNVV
ncbi:serine O-acetyltransferase [Mucilaginibacter sp. FT3.2]|uniref:serine O-acetyltransferase n=1 Tax=Mucilaginibacter sp. FT3.2 TaxID=2723090 RepID=UPI0017C9CDC7|nr:serine acetyltransferase [Mucilaginibacter sp. FT3.2]MBB6230166.1 serine O-acetyltransferase [Mucilaginibacter sp. FT3.2]